MTGESFWTGRRITRRKLLTVAAAGVGVGTLNSCGLVRVRQPEIKGSGTERRGPIKLAVVPKALGFDFWEKVRLGAECAAGRHATAREGGCDVGGGVPAGRGGANVDAEGRCLLRLAAARAMSRPDGDPTVLRNLD